MYDKLQKSKFKDKRNQGFIEYLLGEEDSIGDRIPALKAFT